MNSFLIGMLIVYAIWATRDLQTDDYRSQQYGSSTGTLTPKA
ncbi:MAG: hypothetical protein ACU84Q_20620 [Gammaproteobacteria bacterium]